MSNVKVSIIVAVYNVEKYLNRCLESLINQTLKEIEIILVDDGSTDRSGQICDDYSKKDSRIIVIHKENQGLGMARNSGLDMAIGEYVVFVDSDDFIDINAYKEMYNKIKSSDYDMLMSNYYEYNTKNLEAKLAKTISVSKSISGNQIKQVACQLVGSNPRMKDLDDIGMSVWKNMYCRETIEKNNIRFCSEREFVSEDAIFHLMLVPKMKKIVIDTKAYYYYCQNDSQSLSSTFRESKFEEYKKLYKKELELLEVENMLEFGKYYIATTFLGNVRAHFKQLMGGKYTIKEKRKIAKVIVNDELVQSILTWYPYKMTNIKQRVFSTMIRIKCVDLLALFGRLQGLR